MLGIRQEALLCGADEQHLSPRAGLLTRMRADGCSLVVNNSLVVLQQ